MSEPASVPAPPQPPIDPGDPRLYYAAERTLLAWVRTGLALMGFGFVVARFGLFLRELALAGHALPQPNGPRLSLWIGSVMILGGVGVNLYAAWRQRVFLNAFRTRRYDLPDSRFAQGLAVGLALLGAMLIFYLLIYFGR